LAIVVRSAVGEADVVVLPIAGRVW